LTITKQMLERSAATATERPEILRALSIARVGIDEIVEPLLALVSADEQKSARPSAGLARALLVKRRESAVIDAIKAAPALGFRHADRAQVLPRSLAGDEDALGVRE